ncbi:AAA family ATPase [Pseudothermotoga sp.]
MNRFNLIVGKNNSGKTNLLEALFIHSCKRNVPSFLSPFVSRPLSGSIFESFWQYLFSNANVSEPIILSGETETQRWSIEVTEEKKTLSKVLPSMIEQLKFADTHPQTLSIKLSFENFETKEKSEDEYFMTMIPGAHQPILSKDPVSSDINCTFVPPYLTNEWKQRWFWPNLEDIFKLKMETKLIEVLKVIEPKLEDFQLARDDLYVGIKDISARLPIGQVGNGLIVVLVKTLAILKSQKGVVLIDEFENGLHHSALKKIWEIFKELARKLDVQIVAMTHSLECLKAAYEVFSNDTVFDFSLYRLEQVGKKNRVIRYDGESFQISIQISIEQDLEVR